MTSSRSARRYTYQIALSFAGENRAYVSRVAEALRAAGVRTFYDEFERVRLLGKDLAKVLPEVYRNARYVVVFVSSAYRQREWTRRELRSVLARDPQSGPGGVIPARFDETELPGLRSTAAYQDLRRIGPEDFAALLVQKLEQESGWRRPKRRDRDATPSAPGSFTAMFGAAVVPPPRIPSDPTARATETPPTRDAPASEALQPRVVKVCPVCAVRYPPSVAFCPADGATLAAAEPEYGLVGKVVADRYLLTRLLGEGGMGQVYLAKHVRLPQQAAIKVLRADLARDAAAMARFNREATNASRIEHDRVARVYDFGHTDDGLVYMAMEYVPGRTLKALLAGVPMEPTRVARLIGQVAEGLDAAHRLGIVHRDLKPDNVMVIEDVDRAERVKVVDFGIATTFGASAGADTGETPLTRTGFVVGTPEFMSPEQLLGGALDARTDIYALALVAYQCLTAQLPFPTDGPDHGLTARLVTPPRPLTTPSAGARWPGDVQRVFDMALSRDPDARPASAGAFAAMLSSALGVAPGPSGEPTRAAPAAAPPGPRSTITAPRAVGSPPSGVTWVGKFRADAARADAPRVFISHSPRDRERVERDIVSPLHDHGVATWFAKEDIPGGTQRGEIIARALEECEWFLLALTPNAYGSTWLRAELHWAFENRAERIIPAVLEPCRPEKLDLRLGPLQYVDFTQGVADAQARLLANWGDGTPPRPSGPQPKKSWTSFWRLGG